jgi:stage V sporulation protein S
MSEESRFVNLKVSSSSDAHKVSGAMCRYMAEGYKVVLTAIGASAVNQAVKSLAIGRGIAASGGKDLTFAVGFQDEIINKEKKTAMRFFPILKDAS